MQSRWPARERHNLGWYAQQEYHRGHEDGGQNPAPPTTCWQHLDYPPHGYFTPARFTAAVKPPSHHPFPDTAGRRMLVRRAVVNDHGRQRSVGTWRGEPMTEAQWLDCQDRVLMLCRLNCWQNTRRLRLLAAASCGEVWLLQDGCARQAVAGAERFADGQAGTDQLQRAVQAAKGRCCEACLAEGPRRDYFPFPEAFRYLSYQASTRRITSR
jgi:hypothetical protein